MFTRARLFSTCEVDELNETILSMQMKEEATNNQSASPKKQSKINLSDYPHRIEALKALNVQFKEKTNNKFETMFQKLLDYKEEHGTLRFPSDEQCAASGDEEFIALQKWVKSQVLNFRYSKKKTDPAIVKRFVDIGFSFERWYAKPGKKKGDTNFDEVAKSAAAEAEGADEDQKMPSADVEVDPVTQGTEVDEVSDNDQKMPAEEVDRDTQETVADNDEGLVQMDVEQVR